MRLLPASYYQSDDVVKIAQDLLGKIVYTEINGLITTARIVETEAYRGADDKASHAYSNKRTERTKIMFEKGGISYIYLIYGMHQMLNVVTGPIHTANAVLIRGIEPLTGSDIMLERRGFNKDSPNLTNGPGKLTKALGITREMNGAKLFVKDSKIRILNDHFNLDPEVIETGPRVGIDYAEECVSWPWRFWVKNSPWVSK